MMDTSTETGAGSADTGDNGGTGRGDDFGGGATEGTDHNA